MKACIHSALIVLSLSASAVSSAAQPHPNLVIFLADDAGWGDYSHSGNHHSVTSNIDSIAKDGVSFEHFYVCPVCSPTRAEFLTGRYYPRGGVRGVSTGQERLNLDEHTLAEAFQQAGYATGAFGKWHNGSQWPYHPMARGFDTFFGYTAGHWGEYFNPPLEDEGRMIRTQGFIVDLCTDRALQFIEKNRAQPFLCYLPFTTPHTPWSAPEKNWEHFRDLEITQRATDEKKEQLDETRCALAMLENQDWNVGRVLTRLKELNLSENTIVLYFSDNGPNTFRWLNGMKGKKGTADEGGVRSVCFLRWPNRIPAGKEISQLSAAIDLLPTLTSLAGVKRVGEKPLDGRDLSPLFFSDSANWPDRRIFSTWAGRVSVRTQQYRLDDRGQLYDMLKDPGQTSPVNDQYPQIAAELQTAVRDWRQEMFGDRTEGIRKRLGGNTVDPRPLTVGYREFPITMLPARDGEPHGQVQRSARAPNSSYFVNWTSKADRMIWKLDVHTSGTYEVAIDYTVPEEDAGALIEVQFGNSRLSGRVEPAWNPPLNSNQDTLPRPAGESQMKDFHSLKLGEIELNQGPGELILRALEIPGKTVADVRRVTLTLLPTKQ